MSVRILVVDDEPDVELLIKQRFRQKIRDNEYSFLFAHNGIQALDVLDRHPDVDIVLTDINMPEMDGLSLLVAMKELNRLLKTVVVSAYGDFDNIRAAMNRGAFDFITKPINFQDLEITLTKTWVHLLEMRRAVEARNELGAVYQELDVARRIQQAMVPRNFSVNGKAEIYAEMTPAREVGGDFYDFFWIDEDRLGFAVGDVSGKGIPAALFMAVSRTMLRSLALAGGSPTEVLTRMNELLFPERQPSMFVTIVYGVLDTRTGMLEYCTAGHPPPFVVTPDGEVKKLDRSRAVGVCLTPRPIFPSLTYQMLAGEAVLFYSDGVTEAMNDDRMMFDFPGLESCLTSLTGGTAKTVVECTRDAVGVFTGGAPQSDDITLLAVGVRH
jgi:phosphoserine phosphatase RsbU/P